MAGPNIQMPGPVAEMFNIIRGPEGDVETIDMKPEWAAFLSSVAAMSFAGSRAGSTSVRPPSTMLRWVGMPFFDQTIGKPVFLKHASSNIWVLADGGVA